MGHKAQRFGIRIGRGWIVLFLIAGSLLLAAYWIGPLRPLPAELELLAIEGDVALETYTAQPRQIADGSIVFPVPLAVRNIGAQAARPSRVVLSMPAQFRLATTRGRLPGEVSPGVPLRRYVIALAQPDIAPGNETQVLAGLDTIYIEPDLPRYYCTTQGAQIPEFISAPRFDPATLSDVRIFYAFNDDGTGRQTGLLTVTLDPAALDVTPAAAPPTFRTVVEEGQARAPETGLLSFVGARTAHCGDPEQPVELYTVLWETASGGHVYVVYVDNVGRKRLYDLNRDGIIELETWDGDADGQFEARRDARYAVPEFLVPLPPRDPELAEPDPVPPDTAWLALFRNTERGPRRFAASSLTAHPQVAVADTMTVDSAAVAGPGTMPTAQGPVPRPDAGLGPVRPATPDFLALFADTSAGPFRFSQRAPAVQPRPADATTQPQQQAPQQPGVRPPVATDTTPVVEPAEPDTAAPEPPPRPRRRAPLGTPIRPPR